MSGPVNPEPRLAHPLTTGISRTEAPYRSQIRGVATQVGQTSRISACAKVTWLMPGDCAYGQVTVKGPDISCDDHTGVQNCLHFFVHGSRTSWAIAPAVDIPGGISGTSEQFDHVHPSTPGSRARDRRRSVASGFRPDCATPGESPPHTTTLCSAKKLCVRYWPHGRGATNSDHYR